MPAPACVQNVKVILSKTLTRVYCYFSTVFSTEVLKTFLVAKADLTFVIPKRVFCTGNLLLVVDSFIEAVGKQQIPPHRCAHRRNDKVGLHFTRDKRKAALAGGCLKQ